MQIKRGDLVLCALSGDFGKPRPAVVVQSDLFNPVHTSITLCPITTHLRDSPLFRLSLVPSSANGLRHPSQIMVDKISSLRADKIREKIGKLSQTQLDSLDQALKLWLGLAD